MTINIIKITHITTHLKRYLAGETLDEFSGAMMQDK
jgi:hypothetical protein